MYYILIVLSMHGGIDITNYNIGHPKESQRYCMQRAAALNKVPNVEAYCVEVTK